MNMAAVTKFISRTGLKIRKHLPAIMTAAGIIAGGTCVVTACKQTLKVHEEIKPNLESIAQKREEGAQKADIRKEYISIAGKAIKAYAVPAAFGAASVALTVGGHKVLTKENAALASAYIALDKSFKAYKKKNPMPTAEKVQDEYGNDVAEAPVVVQDTNEISPYARFFDRGNANWCKSPEGTLVFLKGVQNYCNDKLHSNGYLFLNEVYDALGLPRSEAGQYVGWVDGVGDSFVDFGIFNKDDPMARNFVNGYEDAILLDFNVDGPIMYIFESLGKK